MQGWAGSPSARPFASPKTACLLEPRGPPTRPPPKTDPPPQNHVPPKPGAPPPIKKPPAADHQPLCVVLWVPLGAEGGEVAVEVVGLGGWEVLGRFRLGGFGRSRWPGFRALGGSRGAVAAAVSGRFWVRFQRRGRPSAGLRQPSRRPAPAPAAPTQPKTARRPRVRTCTISRSAAWPRSAERWRSHTLSRLSCFEFEFGRPVVCLVVSRGEERKGVLGGGQVLGCLVEASPGTRSFQVQ
jgi:hypothetical protein